MRKSLKFWSLLMLLCLAVFLLSGCGGSADTSSNSGNGISDTTGNESSDSPATNESSDIPADTYEVKEVLDGSWVVMDSEVVIAVDYGDTTINMRLFSAGIDISNVSLDSKTATTGTATISSYETWHVTDNSNTPMGTYSVKFDNKAMTLVNAGKDQWRCSVYDSQRAVINITLLSENTINILEYRVAEIDGVPIEYSVEFNLRKQNEKLDIPVDVESPDIPVDVKSPDVPADVDSQDIPADSESPDVPVDVESPDIPADNESNDIPAENQSEDLKAVLEGTWILMDPSVTVAANYGSTNITMTLFSVSIDIADISLDTKEGTNGTAIISNHETWLIANSTTIPMGRYPIDFDSKVMAVVKTGEGQWIGEIYDRQRAIINITLLTENTIHFSEYRLAGINGQQVEYNVEFNLRRQNVIPNLPVDVESPDAPDDTDINTEPDNNYDVKAILEGTWIVMDSIVATDTDYGDDVIDLTLFSASLDISKIDMDDTVGSNGTATISSHETWHVTLDTGPKNPMGIYSFNFNKQNMTIVKTGKDQWRCEVYDSQKAVINITLLSRNIIYVSEYRVTDAINNVPIEYNAEFNMRRQM